MNKKQGRMKKTRNFEGQEITLEYAVSIKIFILPIKTYEINVIPTKTSIVFQKKFEKNLVLPKIEYF